MNQDEIFEALLKIHPHYHDLVDTDVDEETGEEPETVIFEVIKTFDNDYEEITKEMVQIDTVTLKEIYAEPIEDEQEYKAELTNQFNSEKGFHELNLISLADLHL